jgi:hypothetical protein
VINACPFFYSMARRRKGYSTASPYVRELYGLRSQIQNSAVAAAR